LKPLLDRRNINSPLHERLRAACPAYQKLNNGETVLATIKALHLAALRLIDGDMVHLTRDPTLAEMDAEEEDEDCPDAEAKAERIAFIKATMKEGDGGQPTAS
jgi:hypothetical protein